MTNEPSEKPVRSHPHRLLTLGRVGLYPSAGDEVAGPEGRSGGTPLLAPGKPLALLTYLALAPRRSASREFLLDLLWADMHGDRGRHALRQTLWQLRQLLGESAFEGREEICLRLPVETDRDAFLAAVESGDLEAAVSRYTGHFLPGFAAPGGVEFEQWADRERDRLRSLFIRSADTLARRHLARGQPREAVKLARRIREAEPLAESGWRLLLEALQAAQDRVQVLVEADALEALLRLESRDPEPATAAALRRARQKTDPATDGALPTIVAELVGREREFSTLTQAWGQARNGAVHVLLSSPAGMGKTRLLQDFRARLRTLGARTVFVRANPGERDLPFALAADLAGALGELPGAAAVAPATAATLIALNPALSAHFGATAPQSPGSDQVLQRTIAIAELVSAVAYEAPIAILVDDLHWADPASSRVLHAVRARLVDSRVLMVTTTRPHRDPGREGGDTTVLPLAPLSLAEVGALVSSIAQPPAGPDGEFLITTLWRASGGSPLHVLEALQQVLDAGHLVLADATWQIVDLNRLVDEVSRGESIAGRIKSLDRPASYLLTLLATAGAPCSTELLMHAAARESSGLTEALNRLERRGFITQVRGEWEPAHDEIADAALEVAEPASRQAAARALGEALLRASPGNPLVLRRALQLLLEAGATEQLAPSLVAHAPALIASWNHRHRDAGVAELLGLPVDDETVRLVAGSLPSPPRRAGVLGWVAAAAIAVIAVANMTWPPAGNDGTLPAVVAISRAPDGRTELRQAVIHPRELAEHGPLSLGPRIATLPIQTSIGIRFGDLAVTPKGWAFTHAPLVDNQRTNDIARTTSKGTTYLAVADRDDISPRVSPDRAWIAFASSQWSPRSADDLDIALVDSMGLTTRRLTTGPTSDVFPTWDPSGTRIAFIRKHRVIRPDELCLITMEGTLLSCHPLEGFDLNSIGGWLDQNTIVLQGSDGTGPRAVRFDLLSGVRSTFLPGRTVEVHIGPTARWAVCRCDLLESEDPEWRILPTLDPSGARLIEAPPGQEIVVLAWNTAGPFREQAIQSLRIMSLPPEISLQVTHRPRAEALGATGAVVPIPPGVLRWWSTDPAIARVDSATGTVTPVREGTTTIHVTAGGWRGTSSPLTVRGAPSSTAMTENWREMAPARWTPYGEPRPRVAPGPSGVRGMVPNGDGSHPSGVYSVDRWAADKGIGVEADVSTPVDRTIWQSLAVTLTPDVHDASLTTWDHVSGVAPGMVERSAGQCGVGYPSGEGATSVDYLALAAGQQSTPFRVAPEIRSGRWWRIRLQIFPDGSCGVAMDGVPIWRSSPRLSLQPRFRVWISGHARGTEPMIGPLQVWTGIRPDVDWSVLDSLP